MPAAAACGDPHQGRPRIPVLGRKSQIDCTAIHAGGLDAGRHLHETVMAFFLLRRLSARRLPWSGAETASAGPRELTA